MIKTRPPHPYEWLWEPLESDAGFSLRPMFGGKAVYLDGTLTLFLTAKEEPWRGLLVCMEREQQAALRAEFPLLSPHPILPKWLYLSESDDAFERIAPRLVALARRRDPRFGIRAQPKKKARVSPGRRRSSR